MTVGYNLTISQIDETTTECSFFPATLEKKSSTRHKYSDVVPVTLKL